MPRAFFFKTLFFLLYRILFRKIKSLRRNASNVHANTTTTSTISQTTSCHAKYHKFHSLSSEREDLSATTMIFDVEGSLLRSSSLFSYFMLVAFEAGGLFRSIVLLATYPLVRLVLSRETGLRVMVMICFFGINKDRFRAGSAVLPKFFLEDVGLEVFETLRKGSRRVAVTDLPLVMVESFLRDYLKIEVVVGREMRVFRGYYLGLMEEKKKLGSDILETSSPESETTTTSEAATVGIVGFNSLCGGADHHQQLLSLCQEIYLVSKSDKLTWQSLPREKYPKPLIFHDGRLAVRPTFITAVYLLMWGPLGAILSVARIAIAVSLPYDVSFPILAFSGLRLTTSKPKPESPNPAQAKNDNKERKRGILYVCNHRTLLDPLYLCFALKRNMTALTYSLSRMSEIIAPIRTVRLTRDRDQDSAKMDTWLSQGDLVVCPEGTTCREPYLLRFSPLFSEITDEIAPVAVGTHVTMFHGTTAGGLKCLDPLFFLMNPAPIYTVQILAGFSTCRDQNGSRYDVANRVQRELGHALGYACTTLTRRDKYLILAGNEGIVNCNNKK